MANNVSSMSIYMSPGQTVKLSIPMDERNSQGFFSWPASKDKSFRNGTIPAASIINGFWSEFSAVGELSAVAGEQAVYYRQLRMETNAVWFFALTGEVGVCNIVAVVPHDHSSILSGGPAFGSYFSDEESI